eukprot:5389977-Lingulodinium_polyedra.AAC.1
MRRKRGSQLPRRSRGARGPCESWKLAVEAELASRCVRMDAFHESTAAAWAARRIVRGCVWPSVTSA